MPPPLTLEEKMDKLLVLFAGDPLDPQSMEESFLAQLAELKRDARESRQAATDRKWLRRTAIASFSLALAESVCGAIFALIHFAH